MKKILFLMLLTASSCLAQVDTSKSTLGTTSIHWESVLHFSGVMDSGQRINIYSDGVVVASMSKDSVWHFIDPAAAVITLIREMEKTTKRRDEREAYLIGVINQQNRQIKSTNAKIQAFVKYIKSQSKP